MRVLPDWQTFAEQQAAHSAPCGAPVVVHGRAADRRAGRAGRDGVGGVVGVVAVVTTSRSPSPAREEFRTPDEVIVHVEAGERPDGMGRVMFFAHWLTDQEWVPSGVRAQVFRARLDEWVAAHPRPVRVVEIGGGS